jgi:hypothetical protein
MLSDGKLSYGNGAGARPVRFALDSLMLALPAGKELQGETHGTLLDTAFSATLHGGSLIDIMQEATVPLLILNYRQAVHARRFTLYCSLPTENSGSVVNFELTVRLIPEKSQVGLGLKPGVGCAHRFSRQIPHQQRQLALG